MGSRISNIKEELKKMKELLSKVDSKNKYYRNTISTIDNNLSNISNSEIERSKSPLKTNQEMVYRKDNSHINMVK